NGQTVTAQRHISVPQPVVPGPGPSPRVVITTITPRGTLALLRGEALNVSIRGTSAGTATLVLPTGQRVPLMEDRGTGGLSNYRATITAQPLVARDTALK